MRKKKTFPEITVQSALVVLVCTFRDSTKSGSKVFGI